MSRRGVLNVESLNLTTLAIAAGFGDKKANSLRMKLSRQVTFNG